MCAAEMPKQYDAQVMEPQILNMWLDGKYYARTQGNDDCTVVIPPPNVTGVLHMGHALDDTIQDTYVRYARMQGRSTRWILGTDHAGIATQTRVDKKLKAEGISRLEIGREKFLDACWDWTHEYGGIIVDQIKRMGCSIDFDDEKFTMSEDFSKAVRKVFVDWYHDDLIYQGKRIVNWCPSCTTAISDDEAEYRDEDSHLWHLRYPLQEPVDGMEYIVVATTRPETMLGDTGIAISPDDEDKAHLVGKNVILPIVDRPIPIFTDWHVDKNYGSGFVKVTPAHDPNDYAMGQDHDLEQINIFDEHARVVEGYGEFSGMTRDEARRAIVQWFEDHDLLERIDDLNHSVMHCYRCDSALEPWLSEQWFVAVDALKQPAIDVVKNGEVTFHPKRWENTYTTWMENLKDWCISRQLWWGHRIPVFYCDACGWHDALMEDVDTCPQCGHTTRQDEDVLDTWFSSQLWTFATQGWPDNLDELSKHHPTKVLVTARDIIALWVARMVMSSLYFTKQIPFEDVFIYATILAKDGSRMSKSKGNGVDPMDLIAMYSADAMRYNLLTLVTNNQDVRFDADLAKDGSLKGSPRTEAARSFVTKIWNAARFVQMNLEGYVPGPARIQTQADAWIFSRLAKLTQKVTEGLEQYRFGEITRDVYEFFWNELCDWYIELSKLPLRQSEDVRLQTQRNLVFLFDVALRLLHPILPFVTESIWQHIPHITESDVLMVAPWPKAQDFTSYIDDAAEHEIELVTGLVGSIRSVRARYMLSPKADISVVVRASHDDVVSLEKQRDLIMHISHITSLTIGEKVDKPTPCSAARVAGCEVFCALEGLIDIDAERARVEKALTQAEKELGALQKKLDNPQFLAKAAPEIVEKDKHNADELRARIELLSSQRDELR